MKIIFTLRTGLFLAFILALTNMAAQTTGDYRTTAATTMATATGWQTYNGSAWVQAIYSPVGTINGTQQVKGTGSVSSGSTTVTLSAPNPLIRVNQSVTGTGLTYGTYVTGISGTILTLSQNATATLSNTTLSFLDQFNASNTTSITTTATSNSTTIILTATNYTIIVGMSVTGNGVPAGTKVSAINGSTLTLSAAASIPASTTLTFFAATLTANSTSVTLSVPIQQIAVGMAVTGGTIPNGTIVSAINGTDLTLSQAPTSSANSTLTFFTKETTATTTAASTTITLKAPNSLVAVGMEVYSVTNGLIQNSATVTAINGAEITISIPVSLAYAGLPVQFAFFGTIPNLYINHNTSTANNSKSFHIGNVFVNDSNSTNSGTGAVYTNATLGLGGTSTSSTIFMCETLTVATGAKVNVATTASNLTNIFFITNGVGGNAINNNGAIDLLTPPGSTTSKTNIYFSGPGATTLSGTGTFTFNTFSLNKNTLNLTLAANASINGGTIATGASLIVNEGKVLTNNGTLSNSAGNLILKSSATGTAGLLSTSSVSNVTQQRYLSSNQRGWRLLCNPLAATTFGTVATASTTPITLGTGAAKTYNPATNTWTEDGDDTNSWGSQTAKSLFVRGRTSEVTGTSYSVATPSNVTLSIKGTASNTVPAAVSTTAGQYYLVANPYTAPVSVSSILGASSGLSTTVSYYDPTMGSSGSDADLILKYGGYANPTISGVAGSTTDVVLPPMGAIFVQATSNGTINVPKSVIFTGVVASPAGNYNHKTTQSKVAPASTLKLAVSSNGVYYDESVLQFKTVGDMGSNIDFGKLPNTVLDLYSIGADSQNRAVAELELKEQIIPLGITSTILKDYTIKVAENTLPAGYEAILMDKLLNTNTVMTPGTNYNFAIDDTPVSQGDARFAINLKTVGALSVADATFDSKFQLWPNPAQHQFNILNAQNQKDGASTIEISNVNGQVIHSQKLNPGTTTTIQTNGWSTGVYILKATNNGTQTTKKLIIQ